jgi:hypothetical protein
MNSKYLKIVVFFIPFIVVFAILVFLSYPISLAFGTSTLIALIVEVSICEHGLIMMHSKNDGEQNNR